MIGCVLLACSALAQQSSPPLTFLQRISVTNSFERTRFNPSRINDGSQQVMKNLTGNSYGFGGEFQLSRHFALRGGIIKRKGAGEIRITDPQLAENFPPDMGITIDPRASLKFSTSNFRAGGKWSFLPGKVLNPFVHASIMAMHITSITEGTIPVGFDPDTFTIVTQDVHDVTREWHPEFGVGAGVSFPIFHGIEGAVEYEKVILHSDQVAITTKFPLYLFGIGKRPAR